MIATGSPRWISGPWMAAENSAAGEKRPVTKAVVMLEMVSRQPLARADQPCGGWDTAGGRTIRSAQYPKASPV